MNLLAVWLHDINPYAVHISGSLGIRWYGLSYLLGFFIGYLLIRRVAQVGRSTVKPEMVADLVVTLAIGVVVGGRLGYVLFYQPHMLWTFYGHLPFWEVLAINHGGMASHGGMIGGAVAALWYCWKHKQRPLFIFDLFAFGAPLGLFFGRIANFINGELYGRAVSPSFPLAVKFPQEMYDWATLAPDKLTRAQAQLNAALPANAPWGPGKVVAVIQGPMDVLRTTVVNIIEPMLMPRHPSQLYEAVLEGLVVMAVLLWVWRKPRKPGVVAAWFCIVYGIVRIIGEYFRRPDAFLVHKTLFQDLDITRGQWLSMILLLFGIGMLWFVQRRKVELVGSWRKMS